MSSSQHDSLDPDQTARFDQELAELREHWLTQLSEENRPPLEEALTDDPFLTHQVFALVTESLFPDQAVAFLVGAAKHLLRVQPPERRPLLAGLLELSGPGASI